MKGTGHFHAPSGKVKDNRFASGAMPPKVAGTSSKGLHPGGPLRNGPRAGARASARQGSRAPRKQS